MLTNRIATLVLVAVLGGLLGADKEPAEKEHRYTSAGTRTDKVTVIALGDDDDLGQVRNAKTISGWIEQTQKARTPKNRRQAIGTLQTIAIEAVESNKPIPEHETLAAGLVKALSDKDPEVRGAAIAALDTAATEASVPGLAKAMQSDSDELNQMNAAYALGRIKTKQSVKALDATARSKKQAEHVRRAAIESLGKIGGDQAKAALEGIAKIAPKDLSEDVDKALDRVEGLSK